MLTVPLLVGIISVKPALVICDPDTRTSWGLDGKRTPGYAVPAWFDAQLDELVRGLVRGFTQAGKGTVPTEKPTNRRRLLMMEKYSAKSMSTYYLQFPSGVRKRFSSFLGPSRIAAHFLGTSNRTLPGNYELGMAKATPRWSGSLWLKGERRKGEPFTARLKRPTQLAKTEKSVSLVVSLPESPRHSEWRLVALDPKGRELRNAGSFRPPSGPTYYFFTSSVSKKTEVARIDVYRRPIQWTPLKGLRLEGPQSPIK